MTVATTSKPFELGTILITVAAVDELDRAEMNSALRRHARGDWGEISTDDLRQNQISLRGGGRLVSAYRDRKGTLFYIISEADRSATTVLLPEDY